VEENLAKYKIVIAPVLYMIKPGFAEKVEAFVQAGGTFITTYFSGIVNENDLVTVGGYPGELRKVLGIWAEEIDALLPDMSNEIVMKQDWGTLNRSYSCHLLCDLIHTEGAEVLAEYGTDFYKGMPALTVNSFGEGKAYYVATSPDAAFLRGFLSNLCEDNGIAPLVSAPEGIESVQRVKEGVSYLFLLNHSAEELSADIGTGERTDLLTGRKFSGSTIVPGRGVMILSDKK
jgi:beta-galactosidase